MALNEKQLAFLGEYAKCGNVKQAAIHAGCNRALHFYWMGKEDEEYVEAFEAAEKEHLATVEATPMTILPRKGHPHHITVELADGRRGEINTTQAAFLAAFRECGVLAHAAKAVGISVTNHKRWTLASEFYREAYKEALDQIADTFEATARKRAIEGVQSIKFTKDGTPVMDPRKLAPDGAPKPEWADDPWYYEVMYSDRLLEMFLRAKRPQEFRDNISHQVSGPGGRPMELDVAARQIAVANPELSNQMCRALENVYQLEQQQQQSGEPIACTDGDGDAVELGLDDQPGPLQTGEAPVSRQPEADGPGSRSPQAIDDLLSAPPREERAVQ